MNDLERFIQDLRLSGKAENTTATYQLQLKRYFDFIESKSINHREVTPKEIRDFRNQLAEQGQAPASINLALSAVKSFYEYLLFDGVVTGNPVSKKLKVKEAERLPMYLKSEDEDIALNWLRENTPSHIALAFETMKATGIRVSEAATLTGDDVLNFGGKVFLRIRQGKGQKERLVPVQSAEVARKLLECSRKSSNPPLFKVKAGTLKVYAWKCKQENGIDFHAHRLRHTVATNLLDDDVSLDVIQEILGHSNITTTRRYAATRPEKMMALAADIKG